jgi:hypothetical protein
MTNQTCRVYLRVLGNDGRYPSYGVQTDRHILCCNDALA